MLLYSNILNSMNGTEELLSSEHCSKISMMDGEAVENIFLLILHHFVLSNSGNKQLLMDGKENPYSAKLASKDGRGLIFKVSLLPENLQKIITKYLRMIS